MDGDTFPGELRSEDEFVRYEVHVPDGNAAGVPECLAAVSSFLPDYIWSHDVFALHDDADSRCPWAEAPGPGAPSRDRRLWGEIHPQSGDSADEWFTAFLLSCITTSIPGAVARVWSQDGVPFLPDAADHMPRWVDSSRYGTVPEIAHNRFWIFKGALHMLPIKPDRPGGPACSFPRPLHLATALAGVRDPAASTAAPAKVQEHLLRTRLGRYPAAARASAHRVRVLLPARAAAALLADPTLVAYAVGAFTSRTPDDMRAAERHALLPQAAEAPCTLRMSRSHYAALKFTPFSAPRGWAMPPPAAGPAAARAADLGLKLCFGLEMHAARLGVHPATGGAGAEPRVTADPLQTEAGQRFVRALQARHYFGTNIEGSAQHRELLAQARASFRESAAFGSADARMQQQRASLTAVLRSPIDHAAIERSSKLAEDSDEWIETALDERLAAFTSAERPASPRTDAARGATDWARGAAEPAQGTAAPAQGSSDDDGADGLDGQEVHAQMQRFMDAPSGLGGAEVDMGAFSFDVRKFNKILNHLASTAAAPPGGGEHSSRRADAGESDASDSDSGASDLGESESDSDEDEAGVSDAAARRAAGTGGAAGATSARGEESESSEGGSDGEGGARGGEFMDAYYDTMNAELGQDRAGGGEAAGQADASEAPVNVDMASVRDIIRSMEESETSAGPAGGLLGMMGIQVAPGTVPSSARRSGK